MTGLLTTCGAQFRDWTSSYRLFSHDRLPAPTLFAVARGAVLAALLPRPPCAPTGMILSCAAPACTPPAWLGDAIRSARTFKPTSCAPNASCKLPSPCPPPRVPAASSRSPSPHAPTPAKPGKKASPSQQQAYRAQVRATRLSQRARQQIGDLRAALDADPRSASRLLLLAFDGGYTNRTVLQPLPHHTTAIGRLRQDAHLLLRPDPATRKARGRRLRYGAPAPTPEQVRTDNSPWQTLTLLHNGITHQLRYKRRTGLMWRPAGADQVLQLIVIAPLAYRLRQGSKLLIASPPF